MAQIFISYAREDFQHAKTLYETLAGQGYRPWMDKIDLLGGQKWRPAIEQAIKNADFFLLLLSRNSVKKRGFVQREIRAALDLWQDKLAGDIYLIPIMLEVMPWEEVPQEINEFQWIELYDAAGWEQLERALKFGLTQRDIATPAPVTKPSVAPPPVPVKVKPATVSRSAIAAQPVPSELPLRTFDFVTARVDEAGRVIERINSQVTGFEEDLGHGIRLQMIEIPAGIFRMGSTDAEVEAAFADYQRHYKDAKREWVERETPRHRVAVPSFWMSRYQITQEQWWAVARLPKVKLDLQPEPAHFEGDDLPVEQVSWEEAVEFCQRLARHCQRAYRLPSEAEWEYACRAGSATPFAFGATITPELVNYDGNYPFGKAPKGEYRKQTVPVGSFGVANAFGLFDMHGNVWEWCEDVWHDNYNEAPTDGSAWLSGGYSSRRVLRSGSWSIFGSACRSAYRINDTPGLRSNAYGFRVVMSSRTP